MTNSVDADSSSPISVILAHGLGGRSDLPISVELAQYAAVGVLLLTVMLLGKRWTQPRFETLRGGRSMNRLQQTVDSSAWRQFWAGIGVLGFAAFIAVSALGSDSSNTNPAPTWLYVWLWVGLVPLSALFGPVVRYVNPFRPLSSALRWLLTPFKLPTYQYPSALGHWPAAVGLLIFTWMELVMPERDRPFRLLIFVLVYSVIQVLGGLAFGRKWHEHADSFEVYSTFVGHLSPFQRDGANRLLIANPFIHLQSFVCGSGAAAVIYVLLGSTAFDGITRTEQWNSSTQLLEGTTLTLVGTCGLVFAVAFIALTFRGACSLSRIYMRDPKQRNTGAIVSAFAHALIPIVLGYTVAHYFSLFVFQGQSGYLLATDPFTQGWNLFGLSTRAINFGVVSASVIGIVQVTSILLGHIVGVITAHDRSLTALADKHGRNGQYSIIACMVLYTFGGIGLLLGA